MNRTSMRLILAAIVVAVLFAGPLWSQEGAVRAGEGEWTRDYLMFVGSTTVFPFAKAATEHMSSVGEIKKPMMQATGSGGGFMLFCAGAGLEDVDITCASRRIRESEFEKCAANGAGEIVEIRLGFDGIVLAQSKTAKPMNLSFRDLYLALAERVPDPAGGEKTVENPYSSWKDVNPALPDRPIKVLGPSSGSGTRTIFNRIVMEGGCDAFSWIRAMRKDAPVDHRSLCRTHRDDGAYIAAGENDTKTVGKLAEEPVSLAILSYPALARHTDTIEALQIQDIKPTAEAITDASYPVARPLYLYAKKAHVGHSTGLRAFLDEITSDGAVGDGGYLEDSGLVPLSADERRMWAQIAHNLSPMSMD